MKKLLILATAVVLATTQGFAQEQKVQQNCPKQCPIAELQQPQNQCPRKMEAFKERMQKFEQELQLTDEQKARAKEIRARQADAIKPIVEKLKAKHQEVEAIMNEKLTAKERREKLAPLHKEIWGLKAEMHKIGKAGRDEFKAILTDKQVKKLEKIKKEHRAKFQKKDFRRMHKRPMPPCPCKKPMPINE